MEETMVIAVPFKPQVSPFPCDGPKGCGAEADQPCVLRPDFSIPERAGMPRATLHAIRRRTEQPAPVASDHPPIVPQVIADLEARMAHGVKTYGVALQSGNGRDALRDLYEELLDACCYIKQVMEERDRGIDTVQR